MKVIQRAARVHSAGRTLRFGQDRRGALKKRAEGGLCGKLWIFEARRRHADAGHRGQRGDLEKTFDQDANLRGILSWGNRRQVMEDRFGLHNLAFEVPEGVAACGRLRGQQRGADGGQKQE